MKKKIPACPIPKPGSVRFQVCVCVEGTLRVWVTEMCSWGLAVPVLVALLGCPQNPTLALSEQANDPWNSAHSLTPLLSLQTMGGDVRSTGPGQMVGQLDLQLWLSTPLLGQVVLCRAGVWGWQGSQQPAVP